MAAKSMVALKIVIILMIITVGAFYVQPTHWIPFIPNGMGGVMKGVSAVFFAYIGFDAISTMAEECRDPQRDLPRGMFLSLGICTVLYSLIALVITGIVSYKTLNVADPLAYVFGPHGANVAWISAIIAMSAVIAMASVLLVFQVGQPRIWMAMSRDRTPSENLLGDPSALPHTVVLNSSHRLHGRRTSFVYELGGGD